MIFSVAKKLIYFCLYSTSLMKRNEYEVVLWNSCSAFTIFLAAVIFLVIWIWLSDPIWLWSEVLKSPQVEVENISGLIKKSSVHCIDFYKLLPKLYRAMWHINVTEIGYIGIKLIHFASGYFLFFGHSHSMWNPYHSSDLSWCSDNTKSLTCCTTREW